MKIYVAGHTGLVGSALVRQIERSSHLTWVGKSRSELNLLDKESVLKFIRSEKPDAIIVSAAKVGGIKANRDFPVEFLSQNLQIEINLIESAFLADIDRLIFLGSSCIYPKFCAQPIKEEYLLTGPLEPTNEPYALAKIAGIKLVEAYKKQYGRNWISVMPTNVYGPKDNFDKDSSHVLPALIRKFHDAKIQNSQTVTLWGTGTPRREFIYSDDLAEAILFLLENYNDQIPLNIGTGVDVKILELAEMISSEIGFSGTIDWDSNMPDGTPQKLLDVSKINQLGWRSRMSLAEGIKQTYEWFQANY